MEMDCPRLFPSHSLGYGDLFSLGGCVTVAFLKDPSFTRQGAEPVDAGCPLFKTALILFLFEYFFQVLCEGVFPA